MQLRRRGKPVKRVILLLGALCSFVLFGYGEGKAIPFSWTFQEITGITEDFALEGPAPSLSLYLPVLPGMRPRDTLLFFEYVASPALTRGATLSVYAEGILLSSWEVRPGEHRARISLAPLEGLPLKDLIWIEIRGNLQRSENLCEDLLSQDLFVRIRATSSLFTDLGEANWTVRDFFRFPASRIRIFLPEDLSSKELLAAYLKLSAFLRRSRREVVTEILPSRLPEREDAKELRIILREKALRDIELLGFTLYLTPQGVQGILAELPLFVDRSFKVRSLPLFFAKKRTFQDFGMRSVTLRGVGELRQKVYFTLADLGGIPASLSLNLLFSSTPLPETPRSEAFLKVFLNDTLVFTRKILKKTQKGIERESIFLPPRLLGRENALEIVFAYFPEVGVCRRGTMPFEATIFEQSYFSGTFKAIPDTVTFADAPTLFSGKARVVLPEKPSLEEVETMARLYSALREIDTTPLALEVVHTISERQKKFLPPSLPSLLKALKEGDFRFLFAPPLVLQEYFLVVDREGTFLSQTPVLRRSETLVLTPLPGLETFAFAPDTPGGVLTAQRISGKPALVFTPIGRRDLAYGAFLKHFTGAETLRRMTGNVAIFTPGGWGETYAFLGTTSSLEEAFLRWRLPLFVGTCVVLLGWCLALYRKLIRSRPL